MRAEVKLGLGVSAVVVTVVGGYFLFGRPRETAIPVGGTPVAVQSTAKPGGTKPDAVKGAMPANAAHSRAAEASRTTPHTPAGSAGSARTAMNQPNDSRGARRPMGGAPQPNAVQPGGGPSPSASTDGSTVTVNHPRPVWPPAATPTVSTGGTDRRPSAGDGMANPAATQPQPATLTAATIPSPGAGSEINQPVRLPASVETSGVSHPSTVTGNQPSGSPAGATSSPATLASSQPAASSGTGSVTPSIAGTPMTSTTPTGVVQIPASAPPKPAHTVKPGETATETHRVQPGDTFASLAEAYYGDARLAKFLADSNADLGDARRLNVGMVVKIPPKPADPSGRSVASNPTSGKKASETPVAPGSTRSKAKTYTVKSGDSFYSIARDQLGNANRWKQLYALNKQLVDDDPTRLRPGQVLKLPDEEPKKTP